MIELTINGIKVQTEPKTTILQAATAAGIYIPHLCWDRRLAPYGGCRLCVVEVEGQKKLLAACSTPAEPGMVVHTETPKLQKSRKTVLELLLVHHPLDCPVCDKAGECELQDLAFKYGPTRSRFEAQRKDEPESTGAPLIERNPNRCILCGKCVRVCRDHQGVGAINLLGRGFKSKVSPAFEETLDCEFCGQCVDSCPVGALGTKPYRFRSRVWFMDEKENICPYCGVGCTTSLSLREGRIMRARGRDGAGINEGDLCPRGRFGFDFIESERRLCMPLVRKAGKLEPVSWQEALEFTSRKLLEIKNEYGAGSIGAIGSERCTLEDNYMLKKFMDKAIGSGNIDSRAHFGYAKQARALRKAFPGIRAVPASLKAPLEADFLFVVESDLTATHPVYGLKLLKACRDKATPLFVADSRESKLARWSTRWLRLKRPATGVALVNSIMKVLIDEGIYDKNAGAVAGFAQLKESLKDYAPERAAQITGLSPEDITAAARAIGAAKNPMFFAAFGSSENNKGENLALALANLSILTGRGPQALGMPAELSNTLGMYEAGVRPEGQGLNAKQMLHEKKLKALYLVGDNPLVTFPDLKKVEENLSSLPLLIVQDIMLTGTAKFAHVVLPAASWAEREGTFVNAAGKSQKTIKCLPEKGEARPDWMILRDLGNLMYEDMGGKNLDFEGLSREVKANVSLDFGLEKYTPVFNPVGQDDPEATADDYPLTLVTGTLMQHSGSLTALSKNLEQAVSDAYLQINPEDAKKYRIEDESFVKLTGRSGARIFMKARVTDEVAEGTVFAPSHFPHAKVNLLTSASKNGEAPIVAVRAEPAMGHEANPA
jgi:NADH-quinone oxidoreductase chain G